MSRQITNSLSIVSALHARIALALLFAIFLICTPIALMTQGMTEALLCMFGAATIGIALITMSSRQDYDLFEPYSFVVLAMLFGTTLKALYVAFYDSDFIDSHVLLGQPREILMEGSLVMLIAMAALSAGYFVRIPPFDLSRTGLIRRKYWDRRSVGLILAVVIAISMAAFFIWYRKMGIAFSTLADISQKRFFTVEGSEHESSLGYLSWAMTAAESAFYMMFGWWLVSKRTMPLAAKLALPFMGVMTLFFPLFKSSRQGVATVVLIGLVLVHYLRPGIRIRTVVIVGAIGLSVMMVMTGLRATRDATQVGGYFNVEEIANVMVGGRYFMDLAKTSHVVAGVPEKVPYQYGASFFTWLVAPIPRVYWVGKPSIGLGPVIGVPIFGEHSAGVPPGYVGELYINFGILGIPLGMFIAGVLMRAFYTNFMQHRDNINAVVLYSVVVMHVSFSLVEIEFGRAMISILTRAIPLALLMLVIGRSRRSAFTT